MMLWVVYSKLPLKNRLLSELIFVNFSLGGSGGIIGRRVVNRENTVLM